MDHPRWRREHTEISAGVVPVKGSSPLARGALSPPPPVQARSGSSPLARGAQGVVEEDFADVRIIPARAGSIRRQITRPSRRRDPPRSRGEHARPWTLVPMPIGSSPLTRGALGVFAVLVEPHRIIPARAGSTQLGPRKSIRRSDHPRSRGEHVAKFDFLVRAVGSSPLARGAPPTAAVRRESPGHRGDRPQRVRGSSPLARGALGGLPKLGEHVGIIPGRAGSIWWWFCPGSR